MPLVYNHKHPTHTSKHWEFIVGLLIFLIAFASINTANAALTTGLVAHYCFDDRVNLGKDCSGKGNKGVVQGGVSYTTGIRGGGAKFGGIKKPGDIFVKNSASLRFSKALTVSAFVKIIDGVGMDGNTTNAAVGRHTILAKSHDTSGFWMAAQIDKTNKFTSYGANNSYVKPSFGFGSATTKIVKKAKWVHVVYVIANGVARIYYDGILVSTTKKGTVDFKIANQQNLYIGKYSNKWYPSNAIMDEIRLYNRALTATEVKSLYSTDSTALFKGKFVDAVVGNLRWRTTTRSGTTDTNGNYGFDIPGEAITFSVGKVVLGTIPADKTVHVFDLESTGIDKALDKGTRIAQLLQTLDKDGNPGNGIQLSEAVHSQLSGGTVDIQFIESESNWNKQLNSIAAGLGKTAVSSADAYAHAVKNIPVTGGCLLADTTYTAAIGGKFSTKGMDCHRKAQLAVLYDFILPSSNNFTSGILDDPIISSGEVVVDKQIKSSLERNAIKTAIGSIVSVGKVIEDTLGKERARILIADTMKLASNVKQLLDKIDCTAGKPCQVEDTGYKAGVALIDVAASTIACTTKHPEECAKGIEKFLNSDDLLLDLGYKKPSSGNIKAIAKIVSGLAGFGAEALSGEEMVAVGSFVELTIKTVNGTYARNDQENATRSGWTNLFNIIGEGANAWFSCAAVIQDDPRAIIDCSERFSDYTFNRFTETWYYGKAVGEIVAIKDYAAMYMLSNAILQELYKYPTFEAAYKAHNVNFSGKWISTGVDDGNFYRFITSVFKKINVGFVVVNIESNDLAQLVSNSIRTITLLNNKYLDGSYGSCSTMRLGVLNATGTKVLPVLANVGGKVLFTANASGTGASKYVFNWDDGTQPTNSDLPAAEHTFPKSGYFHVQLIPLTKNAAGLRQCNGAASSSYVKVTIPAKAKITYITPGIVKKGVSTTFAVGSEGLKAGYTFTLPGCAAKETSSTSTTERKYTCTPTQTGTLKLTVSGGNLATAYNTTVRVVDATTDFDGDGMPDVWEMDYGLDPNDPKDAAKDSDGDGVSNLQEYKDKTDPIDKTSFVVHNPPSTGQLNDTGITTCSNGTTNGLPCPQIGYPGQDAQFGRDVTHNNNADGHAGFSFTKISSTGTALPATATSWSCVKDNVTGLIWEVKTDDNGLHDKDWTYTWYEPDSAKNGGNVGTQNKGSCGGTSACDTDAYVKAVNTAGWCGANDWRMPTAEELFSIVALDRFNPTIDTAYFPNTKSDGFFSSSPDAIDGNLARNVLFGYGNDVTTFKSYNFQVRLVRSGQ